MRQHKPTSKAGEEHIKPFKPNHKQKILEGLERLRVGGTQEEIAVVCGLRADQVWKRMVDLQRDELVFDTGITRKLKSGLQGIVWQRVGLKPVDLSNPKTMKEKKNLDTIKSLTLF
jgi:hypothetical protein